MSCDCDADALIGGPPNPSEEGGPRPVPTPAGQTTRQVPRSPSSFSDFLSSNQIAVATSPKPPQKKQPNRSSTFSLKRTTGSILGFRSAKSKLSSKDKAATLPNYPSPGVDEWGIVQSHSAKF